MADPQVNPNALGAPTSGFGQTVTFAFDPRGVTPSLDIRESSPAPFNATGVSHKEGSQVVAPQAPPKDGTADLLMRVGGEILGPKIEEQRNEKFVEGVQKAMQGAAAKDIAQQQPWYASIFGDTPAVAGARAYEVQAKVNDVVSQQTANMDKLQSLDPAAAAKHFSSLINGQMTGDPITDQHIAKGMLDQLPMLMKAQAKAYHGYTQLRASRALTNSMATAGEALQQYGQQYAEATISDEDIAVQKKAFIAQIAPPDGINEETYAKALAENIQMAAGKGQFHVINAIKESGLWGVMKPEQQAESSVFIEREATKYRNQYAFRFAKEIAELKSDAMKVPAGTAPTDISRRIDQMQDAYKKLTGSPQGLFTSDEKADMLKGTFNYLKEEEAQAARRADILASKQAKDDQKALAAAETEAQVSNLIASGDVGVAKVVTKATDDQINIAAYKAFKNPASPQVATDLLRNNFVKLGYVNPILKEEFRGLVRSSEGRDAPTEDFFSAVEKYKALSAGAGSSALADAYFGDYAPRINRFLRMTGGDNRNPNVADAFMASMSRTGDDKPQPLGDKERKKLVGEVSKSVDPLIPRWLGGGIHYRPDTLDVLATAAQNNIEDWRGTGGVPDAEAVKRGIAGAISSGQVEVIGGFAIKRGLAGGGKSLRELAGQTPDGHVQAIPEGNEDRYFETFLQQKLKLEGADLGGAQVVIHHGGVVNGTDRFVVSVAKDGHTDTRTFTGAQWQQYAGEATKHDTAPDRPSKWAFGPALNYNPGNAPGTPSPYADDAKWAAFRAEQRRKAQLKE